MKNALTILRIILYMDISHVHIKQCFAVSAYSACPHEVMRRRARGLFTVLSKYKNDI